mgnify:CR=1 FL=1
MKSSSKSSNIGSGRVLTFTAIALAVTYFIKQVSGVNQLEYRYLLPIIPLVLLNIAAGSLRLKLMLHLFDIDLAVKESVDLTILSTFGNHFLPLRGGAGFRAYYLKKRHMFPYPSFIATMAGVYVIEILVYSICGIGGLILLMGFRQAIESPILLFLTILSLSTILFLLFKPKIEVKNKIGGYLQSANQGLTSIFSDKKALIFLILLEFGFVLINVFRFSLVLKALKLDVGFTSALLYSVASMLSMLVNLTPASIGIREGIVGLTSKYLGGGLLGGVLAGSLDRMMSIIVILTLTPSSSHKILKQYLNEKKRGKLIRGI